MRTMNRLVVVAALALPATAAAEAPAESPFALSIGTGPRPLNQLTLGLTGLGARAMLPMGRTVPYLGLSANSLAIADFEDGARDERYASRVSAVHLSPGVRLDLADRGDSTVVLPYAAFGLVLGRASTRNGIVEDKDWDVTRTDSLGILAGVGFDGFVTRHLSLGAELGGVAAMSFGKSSYGGRDGDNFDTTVLTTFTALQATVWR